MADTILVTGGAGYIGSHVCKALSRSGYTPISYDNLSRGNAWSVKWGPLEVGEIGDVGRLTEVIGKYRPTAIMHFAAYCYVGESVADPAIYYSTNVCGTLSLLESMRRCRVSNLVFSSSCATYGVPQSVPIAETHPQNPTSPYGASKLMAERLLRDYGSAYGLSWVALRYFNAAGADPSAEIGEAHTPETHVIPLALSSLDAGGEPLNIHGNDYPTADGTAIRDYIHVTDLADAHVTALQYLSSGRESIALNLGTGHGHSVLEVIAAVERVAGRKVPRRFGPRRAGDPPLMIADASKAAVTLDWRPKFPDLDSMVHTAWQWRTRMVSAVIM